MLLACVARVDLDRLELLKGNVGFFRFERPDYDNVNVSNGSATSEPVRYRCCIDGDRSRRHCDRSNSDVYSRMKTGQSDELPPDVDESTWTAIIGRSSASSNLPLKETCILH